MYGGLGRIPSPKDDRDYKMSDYINKVIARKRTLQNSKYTIINGILYIDGFSYFWKDDNVLNQGSTQHCVGFGWAGWGICLPVVDNYTDEDGHNIYYECKIIEGQPNQESGATVRAGAKAMQNRKRLGTYFFAASIDEAAEYVLKAGPIVLGIEWYYGMYRPDSTGLIKPTGDTVGGHCILWNGVDKTYAYLVNSWGINWGIKGTCKMTLTDLADVFSNYGEAVAGTELPL